MQGSTSYRRAVDGCRLFHRRWEPEGQARGVVCLIHGIGEHSGRYDRLVEALTTAGYGVSAIDLRGHGRSRGRRGEGQVGPILRDIDELVRDERATNPGLPVFLYGHSLGGLLVLACGIRRRPPIGGAVISGVALHTALREQAVKVALTHVLGSVMPRLRLETGLDAEDLSREPAVVEDYRRDPLVHPYLALGFAKDLLATISLVSREASRFPAPVLLVHGGADQLNYVSGSEELAATLGPRATLRVYDGVLHQPHTDPDSPQVFRDVVAWLDDKRD